MVTLRHESVTAVVSLSTTRSMTGGRGKVAGSGVRWKMMLGFLGSSTDKEADQEVSPLSELAVQVYKAVSSPTKSEKKQGKNVCKETAVRPICYCLLASRRSDSEMVIREILIIIVLH